jgi:hypothetical protein
LASVYIYTCLAVQGACIVNLLVRPRITP